MAASSLLIGQGEPLPLGFSQSDDGFNLAVFSQHATAISLLIFEGAHEQPIEKITLDPHSNRSGDIWHARLSSDMRGKSYALRVDGPWSPEQGQRFDPRCLLLDPYALALTRSSDWHAVGLEPLGERSPA